MIDLGLTKLAVIGAVALVVIGPEKLPRVARMAGTLFGRAQRYINEVKSEVSREIELEELRKMQREVQDAATDMQQSIHKTMSEVEGSVNEAWTEASGIDSLSNPLLSPVSESHLAAKARDFRKKKVRTAALPSWYKKQHGTRTRIMSGAARVARFRPAGLRKPGTSFHS